MVSFSSFSLTIRGLLVLLQSSFHTYLICSNVNLGIVTRHNNTSSGFLRPILCAINLSFLFKIQADGCVYVKTTLTRIKVDGDFFSHIKLLYCINFYFLMVNWSKKLSISTECISNTTDLTLIQYAGILLLHPYLVCYDLQLMVDNVAI